jgi:hypothetical protein
MESVELAATDDGLTHAFFNQNQDPAIQYTYWDGQSWSRITPVLELPEGNAGAPAVAAGARNGLFLIVPNNQGSLYFSRATSGNAATASNWSIPTRLETPHNGQIGSVDVAEDAAGTVYVAYSVPVNDQRGIYLVESKDQGASWSEPLRVFNGAAAGFDLIGAPSLLTSATGALHLVWKVDSIRGDGVAQPLSVYYARSQDGGHTFSDAAPVVQGPVVWRELVIDGKGNLHLFWQQDNLTTVWDLVSLDGGHVWQYPQGLPDAGSLASVTTDAAGSLHLVSVGPDSLRDWLWNGSRWKSEAPPGWSLATQQQSSVALLAATVNKQGNMMVVLAETKSGGDPAERTVLFSTRTLQSQLEPSANPGVSTEAFLPPTSGPATGSSGVLSTPTSTVDAALTSSPGQTNPNKTNTGTSPLTIALVPVGLLLLGVLVIVIRRATRSEGR